MSCTTQQGAALASLVAHLKAGGLCVVAVTQAAPPRRLGCPARATQRSRRRPDRCAFILLAAPGDARAARAAMAKTPIAPLVGLGPPSSGPNEAVLGCAHNTADLAAPAPRGGRPRHASLTTGGAQVQPATNNRRLSAREAEVLRLFAEGALPLQVAQQLYVSPKTVKNHLSHIYAKLGAVNRTQAVALAVKQGVFPFSDLLQ